MKSRIHLKVLLAPLSMLTIMACSPDQFQQTAEYDDVYFTSSDRKTPPKVVTKIEATPETNAEVISLSNSSRASVDPDLVNKYNNSSNSEEVAYFVEGEVGPRVTKPAELNYDDFVWDYENKQLAFYALPADWESDWDKRYFNDLVYNDFEFRLAWYDQYYRGDSDRMDRLINSNNSRIGNSNVSDFNRTRAFVNSGIGFNRFGPSFGISIGFGNGIGFYDPFWDPFFYNSFYDPFFFRSSWRWNRWGWNRWGRFGGFYDPFWDPFYCPPIFSNRYIYRGEVFVARNNRTYTRSGRLRSTSVSSVRADANNGIAPTRSQRLASATGNSRVSRSSLASRSSRGRVSTSNGSGSSSTRSSTRVSSRNSSGLTSSQVTRTRSNRVRTDTYRFDDSRDYDNSGRLTSSTRRGRSSSVSSSRSSRSSSFNRSSGRSSSGRGSGVSFNRSSSSRSSSGVRSSSSRSRSSGIRSGSSRSSSRGGFSRGSSSRSSSRSSGSFSRSSGSRSSGSVSRGSSGGRSSSGSRGSSSSSRSGRRN